MSVLQNQEPQTDAAHSPFLEEEHHADLSQPPPYTSDEAAPTTLPWGGKSFVIRLRGSNQILSVDEKGNGQLTTFAEGKFDPTESVQWECVDKNGWFGFKHDGKFLGRGRGLGRWGNLLLEAKNMGANQGFTVRQHPDGGHQIMALNRWSYDKLSVDSNGDGQKLVLTKDGNALWDFVSV